MTRTALMLEFARSLGISDDLIWWDNTFETAKTCRYGFRAIFDKFSQSNSELNQLANSNTISSIE